MNVAFIGPESSGKTSLALELAKKHNGIYIPEFARDYLEKKNIGYKYTLDDLIFIANQQFISNSNIFPNKIKFIDTEMLVIKIWAKDKFGNCPDLIEQLFLKQSIDLFFLCKPDFPWKQDPLREDKERRNEIFEMYIHELKLSNINFIVLDGDFQTRLNKIELILQSN